MKRLLYIISLFLLTACTGNAQDVKPLLLKGVTALPMPNKGEPPVAVFFTINEKPEIIALTKVEVGVDLRATVIMSTTLGKGRMLLFGSPAYFSAAQLGNNNVKQLLKNALQIAGTKPRIAYFGKLDSAFSNFLIKERAKLYTTESFKLKRGTDILIVTTDVTNKVDLDHIEQFVNQGGTLWFASPRGNLADKASEDNSQPYELGINCLLLKAGAYNYDMVINKSETNAVLITDSIPDYLHIKTVLPYLSGKKEWFELNADYYLVDPMLNMVFKYNTPDAPIFKTIKDYYQIPDSLQVPTKDKPQLLSTGKEKIAAKLAYMFYEKSMDFKNNPTAKVKGYENFPGAVPPTASRVKQEIQVSVKVGTQGLIDPPSVYLRAHTTGLYIPAGEKVKITISDQDLKLGLIAQVGTHGDNVTHLDRITRFATDLVKKFELKQRTTEVYSPYGGLLLLNIPDTTKLKSISLTVDGAVKAPYFKLGETSEADWISSIRNYPAPWAELATDNIVLTVPSYRIRELNNPVKLMKFWDEVMDANAELAVIDKKRVHQERIIVDNDVAYGYMFTTWERIVVPDDQSCEWMLNEEFIRKNGSWGTFHELGHRHQFGNFDFPGTGEVTVNLYTMYVYDKVLHKGVYNHDNLKTKADVINRIKTYLDDNPSYEKWSADPFLALSMYVQIIDRFGWGAILDAHKAYRKTPESQYPKTDQDKRDLWFINISNATKRNLSEFFDTWKVPVSDVARKSVQHYQSWFPEELRKP
nr:M60 family metallopeptidase [Pedobacter panaciterrae]